MRSSSLINCSWHELENYLQPHESDFQRLGKLGGGLNDIVFETNKKNLTTKFFSGTYGDVFRVRHRLTGQIYALKQIRDEHDANGIPATAMREAAILKQLNHPNIIQLEEIFLTDERCYFLLEYMDEDLKRYLDKHRPLDRRMIQVEKERE